MSANTINVSLYSFKPYLSYPASLSISSLNPLSRIELLEQKYPFPFVSSAPPYRSSFPESKRTLQRIAVAPMFEKAQTWEKKALKCQQLYRIHNTATAQTLCQKFPLTNQRVISKQTFDLFYLYSYCYPHSHSAFLHSLFLETHLQFWNELPHDSSIPSSTWLAGQISVLPYKITRAGFWLLAYTCKCWYSL